MTPDFRALCADPLAHKAYVAFVQICKGGSDDAGTYESDEQLVRLALKRLDALESAALSQPAPEPPTDGPNCAAVLRAAVDQVLPEQPVFSGKVVVPEIETVLSDCINNARDEFLAIATELENINV
jgi:hypothetical protein